MPGGAIVDGAPPVRVILRNVQSSPVVHQLGCRVGRVVSPLRSQSHQVPSRYLLDHCQRRFGLGRAGGMRDSRIHDQFAAILGQGMNHEAELRPHSAHVLEPRIPVGCRFKGGVLALLPLEVGRDVPYLVGSCWRRKLCRMLTGNARPKD